MHSQKGTELNTNVNERHLYALHNFRFTAFILAAEQQLSG